mmetsp:Transcript_18796/g.44160  ORF Transcript_18796/g.44160 Transcript_18796/m.44160 type:complete len:138 (+) Transcript_18796:201-614(+)
MESLGWVLCHGLMGDLPWFSYTKRAKWKEGKLVEEQREEVCWKVAEAKAALLDQGAEAFGAEWQHLEALPCDLAKFLRAARDGCQQVGHTPDYRFLDVLLGGRGSEPEIAEEEDIRLYSVHQRRCEAAACYLDNLRR